MKNLANCTPREFVKQTGLMADALENWIKVTDIVNIRREVPDLPAIPDNGSEGREKAIKERSVIIRKAAMENAFKIVRKAFKEHPDETLEVVAYACFIPLDEIDNYKMSDILRSVTELINDKDVLDFFISFQQLDQKNGS